MRRVSYKLKKESWDDMIEAGRLNPSLEIIFRDKKGSHKHKIGSGYSDDIYAYREAEETFILSLNEGLGYISLECFKGDEQTGDIFIESHEVENAVGKCGLDLAPHTIIRRLMFGVAV